jgi:hypothetical protein
MERMSTNQLRRLLGLERHAATSDVTRIQAGTPVRAIVDAFEREPMPGLTGAERRELRACILALGDENGGLELRRPWEGPRRRASELLAKVNAVKEWTP